MKEKKLIKISIIFFSIIIVILIILALMLFKSIYNSDIDSCLEKFSKLIDGTNICTEDIKIDTTNIVLNTISYEIISTINVRVEREYLQ